MRWRAGRRSQNIEDRRAEGDLSTGAFGSRRPLRVGRTVGVGGGLGGLLLVVVLMLMGIDPSMLLTGIGQGPQVQTPLGTGDTDPFGAGEPQFQTPASGAEEELKEFVAVVLADTEDTWSAVFQEGGERYQEPALVLFSGLTRSACGLGEAAMGPFYCPGDQKVYIDLAFYDELRNDFGAPGDFAQAYVIAHEVGHHVQNLLGTSDEVETLRRRVGKAEANRLSVMLELQADCFAGVWANNATTVPDPDTGRPLIVELTDRDIADALSAAAAVGDDRIQEQVTGRVDPESWTHGSAEQRQRWFRVGFETGDPNACDTFAADPL
jgi:hypothetical protein